MRFVTLALVLWLGVAVASLSAGTLAPCTSVAGNVVTNCGFEKGDFTGWTTGGNSAGIGVTFGSLGAINGPNSGAWWAYLGAAGGDATLSQTLTTTPGASYTFSFYFGAASDIPSDFSAYWNGASLLSLTNPTVPVYTQFSYSVTGTGQDTIQFNSDDDPNWMALDDVVVTSGAPDPGVPEPGTMGMLSAGLGAAMLARRFRPVTILISHGLPRLARVHRGTRKK